MLRDALEQGPIWALGAMSGTSLDGVDAALIQTDGATIFGFGDVGYRPYSKGERAILRAAMGRWDKFEAAQEVVEQAHIAVLRGFSGADLVGFHGQTTAHDPGGRGTCQIGDGQVLADALRRPVVWDFRTKDVQSGGQGAPLAPFFHHACAQWAGLSQPVAFLNLGGVGNLTWLNPALAEPDEMGACLAFDTGPANAPLNDVMQARLGVAFDDGGQVAGRGTPDKGVLQRLEAMPFFAARAPKSLDRDDFGWLTKAVAALPVEDAAATVTAAVARSVALGVAQCPTRPSLILVTGGGRKNPVMMAFLADETGCDIIPVETIGLDGDMLEAQAFGYLAVRALRGWSLSAPGTTGVARPVRGGRLSQPSRDRC